jgi:Zn-dependent membrane protease YugP
VPFDTGHHIQCLQTSTAQQVEAGVVIRENPEQTVSKVLDATGLGTAVVSVVGQNSHRAEILIVLCRGDEILSKFSHITKAKVESLPRDRVDDVGSITDRYDPAGYRLIQLGQPNRVGGTLADVTKNTHTLTKTHL